MRPDRRPSADPAELALRLREGAAELGLVLAEPVLRRLLEFVALLARWNAVYNLTAIRDPRDMLVQHLLDALSIVPPLRRRLDLDHSTIADVGSGAGLPGLPLAIVHPGARVVSIEPVGKKTAFQRQVCSELALTNVEVYTGRAESMTRAFDLVTCRAFASLADFVDAAARLAGPTTLLVAMKGPEPTDTVAKIFAIANQKGGVGKTTTSVNLAAALARLGQRVLLVDLDPQGNATMGSGIDKRTLERTVYQVLIGLSDVTEASVRSEAGGYHVLPANRELAGAEIELVDFDERETRLKDALAAVDDQYDFILIDAPPALSLLTLNGLCAAHGVVIPMQCEYYALEGLSDLVSTIKKVHANLNTNLKVIGLLRVMFDPRMTLSQQVSAQLERHFGDKVFRTVIPRNIRLAEAPSYGQPGVVFDPGSKGAKAYVDFGAEMIERLRTL